MLHFQSTKVPIAILIALIVCSNVTPSQVDTRLTAASSKFSFKLYDQLLKSRKTDNTFASPASVMLALAMTYNGANGTTRESMARTLELEGMSLEDVNRAFVDLKSALAPDDPKIQLKIAELSYTLKVTIFNQSCFRMARAE